MSTSKDALEQFEEESDAFFNELLQSAGSSKASAKATAAGGSARSTRASVDDIEKEYALLSETVKADSSQPTPSTPSTAPMLIPKPDVATFDLSRADSDGEHEADHVAYHQDYTPPAVPNPPADFTKEDRVLHQQLADFYLGFNPENIANVNKIVQKYRGRAVANLWAMLALKYNLPPHQVVDLLAKTLYLSSGFEHRDQEKALWLEEIIQEIQAGGALGRAEFFERSIERGSKDGSDALLRMLCFRGIPDAPGLRPKVWKVLLGYLPLERRSEWSTIEAEKRDLYKSYREELLVGEGDDGVYVREGTTSTEEVASRRELLQEIKNDVDRTRRDFEWFRRPATCSALLALLFVYARLNPGVRYVQGMNELAAVLLYVLSADGELAEADTFWCFNELMGEIKEGFMQLFDGTREGVQSLVGGVARLMQTYDHELAQHLQRHDLPPFVFVFRWCTLLFAQDAQLPDVVRLWDSFIADPHRFEFCMHMCLAVILANREELLQAQKQFALAEVLQSAPHRSDFDSQVHRAWAICALERRPQTPPFPPKSTLQVVDDMSEWAQTAAKRAQELGLQFSSHFQENIAPVMMERANQASQAAADGAQAFQGWLEETAPARREAIEQAQSRVSSWWSTVRATSTVALQKGQQFAAEVSSSEAAQSAQAKFSQAAGTARSSASEWFSNAAAALATPGGEDGQASEKVAEEEPRASEETPACQAKEIEKQQ